jgi:hypothetical protein
MPYPIPCKYCINFLCKLSLFQKTELLLRDHISRTSPLVLPMSKSAPLALPNQRRISQRVNGLSSSILNLNLFLSFPLLSSATRARPRASPMLVLVTPAPLSTSHISTGRKHLTPGAFSQPVPRFCMWSNFCYNTTIYREGVRSMATKLERKLDTMINEIREIRKELILSKSGGGHMSTGRTNAWKALSKKVTAQWDHVPAVDEIRQQREKMW